MSFQVHGIGSSDNVSRIYESFSVLVVILYDTFQFSTSCPCFLLFFSNICYFKDSGSDLFVSYGYFYFEGNLSNGSDFPLFIYTCFVLECMIGFLVILMALLLSHDKRMCSKCMPKLESCCLSHKIGAQQLPATMYLAFSYLVCIQQSPNLSIPLERSQHL